VRKLLRPSRIYPGLVPVVVALVVVFAVQGHASTFPWWGVQDDCSYSNPNNNPYFFADGPVVYYFNMYYTASDGMDTCAMATSNETTWTSDPYDQNTPTGNQVFWYLPAARYNATGSYSFWAYTPPASSIPSFAGPLTRNAHYFIWPYGHVGCPTSTYCGALYNCWVDQGRFNAAWNRINDPIPSCNQPLAARSYIWMCDQQQYPFTQPPYTSDCGGFVKLRDDTGEAGGTFTVAFDDFVYCSNAPDTQNCGPPAGYAMNW